MKKDKDDEQPDPRDNLKNPLVERVCPLCRVFGTNIKFMDLRDDSIKVSLTIVTCLSCRGVYSMNIEYGEDGKPVP